MVRAQPAGRSPDETFVFRMSPCLYGPGAPGAHPGGASDVMSGTRISTPARHSGCLRIDVRAPRGTTDVVTGKRILRVVALGCVTSALAAQAVAAQELTVRSDLPSGGFIDRRTPVRITPDRPLEGDARLAVLVAGQDVTALLTRREGEDTLEYDPSIFPLPAGEHELAVFVIDAEDRWTEVARFPIRVRGALGFEERRFEPGLDIGLKSQPAENHDPAELTPERATYGQLDGQMRLGLEQLHAGFSWGADVDLVGTSYQKDALRFFRDGDEAPHVDLASYAARIETEPVGLTVGDLRFGDHRHLTNGISARGARVDLDGGRVDGSFVASSAVQIVGWDNPVGLGESDDRILMASLGVDALSTPGGLRLDASWMSGRQQPTSGFNQGVVSDFEKSDGFSLRLRSSALKGRLRLDAGYAESQFVNPEDSLLAQDRELVEVRETRRDARYIDADVDVLRDVPLWGAERARLSVGYRHERVDPLYRVVGSYMGSDRLTNRFDVRADIAWLTLGGSFGRGEDNLDDLPSVLTTRTDRRGFTAALPLQRGASWLPSLNYRLDRTHQLGLGVPVDGGFDESHIPDQVSLNHAAGATWQLSRVRLGLQYDVSDQDNRQPGREDADFLTRRSSVQVGVTPATALDLGLDLSLESRDDQGAEVVTHARRWSASASLRPFRASSLSFSWSDTFQDDDVETFERSDQVLSAGWTSFVPFFERFGGQYFLRFNYQSNSSLDVVQELESDRMVWTLQFGLNLSAGRR